MSHAHTIAAQRYANHLISRFALLKIFETGKKTAIFAVSKQIFCTENVRHVICGRFDRRFVHSVQSANAINNYICFCRGALYRHIANCVPCFVFDVMN